MTSMKRVSFGALFFFWIVATGFLLGNYLERYPHDQKVRDHQSFHEILNLTEEQMKLLVPIEERFATQRALYENQIQLANVELGAIIIEEKNYTPRVQAAVKKIHDAMGRLQEVTLTHYFEMRILLDDKQIQILDSYVVDVLHEP